MAYRAMALLPPNTAVSITELQPLLQKKFINRTNVSVSISPERAEKLYITVEIDAWQIRVSYSNDLAVLTESQEIADHFAKDREDKDLIASCDSRIEVHADNDPNMDYFNDYIFVLEALETIEGAILIDTNSWKFI